MLAQPFTKYLYCSRLLYALSYLWCKDLAKQSDSCIYQDTSLVASSAIPDLLMIYVLHLLKTRNVITHPQSYHKM